MDEGGLLWTERIEWAAKHSRRKALAMPWDASRREFPLANEGERLQFARECKSYLKGIADAERRKLAEVLIAALDAPPADVGRQMLTWDEIRATRAGTTYGGHSHTHPILSQMTAEAAAHEIRACSERLEAELGQKARTFAYPNGRACDFNADIQARLREQGVQLAFSTIQGINVEGTDPLALRRQHPWDSDVESLAMVIARA
jgi:hypothetical protein